MKPPLQVAAVGAVAEPVEAARCWSAYGSRAMHCRNQCDTLF